MGLNPFPSGKEVEVAETEKVEVKKSEGAKAPSFYRLRHPSIQGNGIVAVTYWGEDLSLEIKEGVVQFPFIEAGHTNEGLRDQLAREGWADITDYPKKPKPVMPIEKDVRVTSFTLEHPSYSDSNRMVDAVVAFSDELTWKLKEGQFTIDSRTPEGYDAAIKLISEGFKVIKTKV